MTCSKLASGRAVLLGDAAHSVSPNVGMGCNAALQDSEVLSRACIAAGGDVTASAAEYADTRLTNSHVLTRVSERLDAVQSFGYTKDIFAALRGLPYHLVQQAGFGVSSVPGLHTSPCPRPPCNGPLLSQLLVVLPQAPASPATCTCTLNVEKSPKGISHSPTRPCRTLAVCPPRSHTL